MGKRDFTFGQPVGGMRPKHELNTTDILKKGYIAPGGSNDALIVTD